MVPAFFEVLTLTDFSRQPQTYQDLVNSVINYCNQNRDKIFKKAKKVYKIGTNRNHPLFYTCCDFVLLEEKSLVYKLQLSQSKRETATTEEDRR